jgi:hypothetical protein
MPVAKRTAAAGTGIGAGWPPPIVNSFVVLFKNAVVTPAKVVGAPVRSRRCRRLSMSDDPRTLLNPPNELVVPKYTENARSASEAA